MLERRTFLLTGVLGGGAVLTLSYRGWMPGLAGFRLGSRPVYFLPGGKGAQLLATIEALDATDALGEAWLAARMARPYRSNVRLSSHRSQTHPEYRPASIL